MDNDVINGYENENPINTKNFTFEQAVGGCYSAAEQILKLNEKIDVIDDIIKAKKINMKANGTNGIKNIALGSAANEESILKGEGVNPNDCKANKNYPENEVETIIRKTNKRRLKIFIWSCVIAITLILLNLHFFIELLQTKKEGYMVGFVFLGVVSILIISGIIAFSLSKLPKKISKELKTHPWRFNFLPLGSPMYLLQKDFNNILEEIHRAYYNTYLPCKRKAEELIYLNRDNELYKCYHEIIMLDSHLLNCTPHERLVNHGKKIWKEIGRNTLIIGGVALAATAAFAGMVNNAGKDIGRGGGHRYDPYTGERLP